MTMQNYFVLTESERDTLVSMNTDENVRFNPRAINQPVPGAGINLSEEASEYEAGNVVTLVGKFIVPQVGMTDAQYLLYLPHSVTYLRTLPWCSLQDETIFLPPGGI